MEIFSIPIALFPTVAVLVFSRVGSCIMILPGFATARVPMHIRLYVALGISFAVLPIVAPTFMPLIQHYSPFELFSFVVSESFVGLSFGIMAHIFLWVFQFVATVCGVTIGFSGQPGLSILESRPESPLVNLLSLCVLVSFFALNLHAVVFRGLIDSYQAILPTVFPRPQAALVDYKDALEKASWVLLRIASPFISYSILVNFMLGLINKLAPNLQIYFVFSPLVMIGGVFLLYFLFPDIVSFFIEEMSHWVEESV